MGIEFNRAYLERQFAHAGNSVEDGLVLLQEVFEYKALDAIIRIRGSEVEIITTESGPYARLDGEQAVELARRIADAERADVAEIINEAGKTATRRAA